MARNVPAGVAEADGGFEGKGGYGKGEGVGEGCAVTGGVDLD